MYKHIQGAQKKALQPQKNIYIYIELTVFIDFN